MPTKCDFCEREVPDRGIAILTIHLADLCSEKPVGDDLELNVCYDCAPTVLISLKTGIKFAAQQILDKRGQINNETWLFCIS